MKLVYIEENEELSELISLRIKYMFNIEVLVLSDFCDAMELIRDDSEVKIVLSEYNVRGKIAQVFLETLRSYSKDIPLVVLTSADQQEDSSFFQKLEKDHPGNGYINKITRREDFKEVLNNALESVNFTASSSTSESEYTSVPIEFLCKVNSTPVDLYIKLSNDKFVHLFSKNEVFSSSDITKYQERKIESLYVKSEEIDEFLDHFLSYLTTINYSDFKVNEQIEIQGAAHALVHKYLNQIGVNEHSVRAAEEVVRSSLELIENNKQLYDIFNKIKDENDYLYQHSLFIAYIGCSILENMDWTSRDIKTKITLAAMMHDISITDSELIKSVDLIEGFTPERKQKKEYYSHPEISADMVLQMSNFPSGIDTIIINHHEEPNGTGFPKGLNASQLSPLSCIFILSHQFSNYLFTHDFNEESRADALKFLEKDYQEGNFKKVFQSLCTCFI
jgi:HD-GYP domain-containing protein (c-di-GMP phosphodiesterase class II)